MEKEQSIQKETSLIRNILFVLKKNLFLILAIIFITTSLGIGYSFIKKPKYTAGVKVNFYIEGNTTTAINEMRLYIDTIVDFCGQGVVVDRANAYYLEWIENYQQDYYAQNKTIEEFYKEFATPIKQITYKPSGEIDSIEYNNIFNKYERPNSSQPGTLKDESFLSVGEISTKTAKNEQATNWVYTVSYTDANRLDAVEKVFILVLAYKHELYWNNDLGSKGVEQYFTGLAVNIDSLGIDGVVSSVSKTKITIIAFAIGVALAFLVVYIRNMLDNTIKDKDELERITGAEVLASINFVREKDKNGK